jgi:hypothetical protein
MSRQNKVNPDHYTSAGRLSPDDWARERRKQAERLHGETRKRQRKPLPPWLANEASADAPNSGSNAATEPGGMDEAIEDEAGEMAEQLQAKRRAATQVKSQAGGTNDKKPAQQTRKAAKQQPRTGATRGVRSAKARPKSTTKASGARGTSRAGKAKASKTVARGKATARSARKTAARGVQRAKSKRGVARKAKSAKKR